MYIVNANDNSITHRLDQRAEGVLRERIECVTLRLHSMHLTCSLCAVTYVSFGRNSLRPPLCTLFASRTLVYRGSDKNRCKNMRPNDERIKCEMRRIRGGYRGNSNHFHFISSVFRLLERLGG